MISKKIKILGLASIMSICALTGVTIANEIAPSYVEAAQSYKPLTARINILNSNNGYKANISAEGASDRDYQVGYTFSYTASGNMQNTTFDFNFARPYNEVEFKLTLLSKVVIGLSEDYKHDPRVNNVTFTCKATSITEKVGAKPKIVEMKLIRPIDVVTNFKLSSHIEFMKYISYIDLFYSCRQ